MERARPVESGFFPLDEELGLLAGNLTPHQQESLVRLGVHMPFEQARAMLTALTGVQVSEATARRQTQAAGQAYERVQQAQAQPMKGKKNEQCGCRGCQPPRVPKGKRKKVKPVEQMVLSSDGVLISLVGGKWVEVKTLAIAEIETDAQSDALRILDFAHAAGYLSEIATLVTAAGATLAPEWVAEQLHTLKHEGPKPVLAEVAALREQYPQVEELGKKATYLQKREQHMQYPAYQEQGWPIGSGMVESANKHVVQARLKGAGMHWAPEHVNPMLALRTAERNESWLEAWQQSSEHRRSQRMQQRIQRQQSRYQQVLRAVQCLVLLLYTRKPRPTKPTRSPSAPQHVGPARPASDHPWRRRFLAKK